MEIIIISKNNCVFCIRRSYWLRRWIGIGEKKMEEFDEQVMVEDIGKQVRTIQIKIDGKLVGGYNQLVDTIDQKGKLQGEIIDKG